MDEALLNLLCTAYTSKVTTASLHTAAPGTTGANEDTGVARAAVTWSPADDGADEATITWNGISNDAPWTHIGFWDGTTFRGFKPFAANLPAAGKLTVLIIHNARAAAA